MPGQAAADPGLGASAPPAGPGRASPLSLPLLVCSLPRPSHIQRYCSLSHSARCGSDLGSTGHRLGCRLEGFHSRSHQRDTPQSHTVGDTVRPGTEASTGNAGDSPSRGLGPPGNSPLHPSLLLGHCSQHRRSHHHLGPHTHLPLAFDTGALESQEGRCIESPGCPTQGSQCRYHCAGRVRGDRSPVELEVSDSQGPQNH